MEVEINKQSIKFIVDTGSSVNIIDKSTCNKIGLPVRRSTARLMTYGSEFPIDLHGEFKCTVAVNGQRNTSKIYVINKNKSGCLLGKETAISLGIVTIGQLNQIEAELDSILAEHEELFEGTGKLKDFKLKLHIDHAIKPVAQSTRRVPYHLKDKVAEKIRELEKLDIIEETDGPTDWVSPLIVSPKRDGDIRIIIDMRRANEAILRERHPIPTLEQLKQEMRDAVLFSKLDLKMGYHQLELDEDSRPITTFSTPIGLRRYKRLSLGVTSASESYQHTLEQKVLYGLKGVKNISDDIIVRGTSVEDHHSNLRALLKRLQEVGLTLNRKKCEFARDSLTFFGIVLSKDGAKADPEKVKAINEMVEPNNVQELRSFMGLATYMSSFINNFAEVVEPLRQILRKGVEFQWNVEQSNAFKKLQSKLMSDQVMTYWSPTAKTRLTVDASPHSLGAILEQEQADGKFKVLEYPTDHCQM